MKATVLVFFVVLLALAVVSAWLQAQVESELEVARKAWLQAQVESELEVARKVPANHHKRHRSNNIKAEEYNTFDPSESDYGDGGDFEWPEVDRIRNFDLPNVFGPGRVESSRSESVPAKNHGKSGHRAHSH